jgi:hypothetical protein
MQQEAIEVGGCELWHEGTEVMLSLTSPRGDGEVHN